jgi:hypothetical protein
MLSASCAPADDADRMLSEAGRLTEARYGRNGPEWMGHQNQCSACRPGPAARGAGRHPVHRAVLGRWRPEYARDILVYKRNTIAILIRLGEYAGLEARMQALLPDMDKLMGAGNDLSAGFRHELARLYTETGQPARALAQREENRARAQAAGVQHPAVLVPLQVHVLLARTQLQAPQARRLERPATWPVKPAACWRVSTPKALLATRPRPGST